MHRKTAGGAHGSARRPRACDLRLSNLAGMDAFFRLLGANFFGPLLQASFVLLKRDPDNQIATDDLTA
jgi:hypothetical protein